MLQQNAALSSLYYLCTVDCPKIESFFEGGVLPNLRKFCIIKCEKIVSSLALMDLHSLSLTHREIKVPFESFPKAIVSPSKRLVEHCQLFQT